MAAFVHNRNCITPKMTSSNTPSPVVVTSLSQWDADWAPWGVFTQSATDRSWSANGALPQWIKVDLGAGNTRRVYAYTMTGRHDNLYFPSNATGWTLQGSNDDSNWTALDTQSGQVLGTSPNMLTYNLVTISDSYRYFRVNVTACDSNANPCIGELQLLGVSPVHIPLRGRSRL